MKSSFVCIFFSGILILVACAPIDETRPNSVIIQQKNAINPDGNYMYSYQTSDGIEQEVEGILKEVNGSEVYNVKGFYKYNTPDNEMYKVTYIADENGFQIVSIEKLGFGPLSITNPKVIASLLG